MEKMAKFFLHVFFFIFLKQNVPSPFFWKLRKGAKAIRKKILYTLTYRVTSYKEIKSLNSPPQNHHNNLNIFYKYL